MRSSKPLKIKMVKFFYCLQKLSSFQTNQTNEENAIADVTNVAEDIVKCSQFTNRLETHEIIVAKVLITTFVKIEATPDDKL